MDAPRIPAHPYGTWTRPGCVAFRPMKLPSRSERAWWPRAETAERWPRLVLADDQATPEEVLHALLAPTINRLVWAFLGADPERDDIAHDIFIRILRGASKVRDPKKLEPWAVRVAMNCIKNEFRRRKFRRWVSWDTVEEPPQLRFDIDFHGRELLRRTYQLLDKLPLSERLPFTLQLLDNASLQEIAKLCACSERTAKRRLQAARERFELLARRDPLLASRISPPAGAGRER